MDKKIERYQGFDGIPFYGYEPMHVNPQMDEHKHPKMGRHVYVRIFDLSKVKDCDAYQVVSQKLSEEYVTLSYEERLAQPEKGTWIVLMRWFEDFYYNPAEFPNGIQNPPVIPDYVKGIDSNAPDAPDAAQPE